MRRTSTGRALTNPVEATSPAKGPHAGLEGAATAPGRPLADSPSSIIVIPVDVLRRPHDDQFARRAEGIGAFRICPTVHISTVNAQRLSAHDTDAVVLDARTVRPAMVYRSVARLRSAGAGRIVLVLEPADLNVIEVCTSLGVTDFVLSTASTEELVVRIRRARRVTVPRAAEADGSSGSGIELHWRTHEVSAGAMRIALTLRELQLLAALMDRAGEVLTGDDLARLAWGKRATGGGGLTAAYVCSLRRKLAWFGGRFGIRTVRGVGYRFVV